MSQATSTRIKSSLSRKMAAPGGRTVAEALAAAEKGLECHREAGMVTICSLLGWLEMAAATRAAESEG